MITLEELLRYKIFATKDELLFLLFEALPLSNNQQVKDFKKYCSSNHYSLGLSFDGTLRLLEFIQLLSVCDEKIKINSGRFNLEKIANKDQYFEQGDFLKYLFQSLKQQNAISDFIMPDAVKLDISKGNYYLKDNLIPIKFLAIRNLLISLGFLEFNQTIGTGNLFVNHHLTELFRAYILETLEEETKIVKRKISLLNLKNNLIKQEEFGRRAEYFVFEFEKKRLQNHDGIKIISDDFSNAGYDIESFNEKDSIFVDRYIEVKSHGDKLEFFWSKNEIEVAKQLNDNYYLYLVDRNRMEQTDYIPKIFQNPYQNIYLNEFWQKDVDTWIIRPLT